MTKARKYFLIFLSVLFIANFVWLCIELLTDSTRPERIVAGISILVIGGILRNTYRNSQKEKPTNI